MASLLVLRPVDPKWRISAQFGSINPRLRDGKAHKGVDFACPVGTPVRACFNGVLALLRDKTIPVGEDAKSVKMRRAGNRVGLYNQSHRALYFHLSEFFVKVGDTVKAGDILAYSGATGDVTGPHLHFELRDLASDVSIKPEFEDSYYDKPVA